MRQFDFLQFSKSGDCLITLLAGQKKSGFSRSFGFD